MSPPDALVSDRVADAAVMSGRDDTDDSTGDEPISVLVLSTRGVIDMIYVDPAHRGRGVAGALYRAAVARHGRIGTDARLTESGVAFARRYRVPLYNASRRKAVLDAEEHERRGAEVLRYAARVARR